MTTNFRVRDFFVYLLTGLTLIISIGLIFHKELFCFTVDFFTKYQFVKDFAFLVTILLIPTIYLLGNIIGSLSYELLQLFIFSDKSFKKNNKQLSKWKIRILIWLQIILYRQRVVYAVVMFTKTDMLNKPFNNINEFWTTCAKLQIEKIYAPAEYWYLINELFNSVNLIFFISTIISFLTGHWILAIIYFFLTIFAFRRARQYADHFITTVVRLTNARQTIQKLDK
jgi:hypothetical protein